MTDRTPTMGTRCDAADGYNACLLFHDHAGDHEFPPARTSRWCGAPVDASGFTPHRIGCCRVSGHPGVHIACPEPHVSIYADEPPAPDDRITVRRRPQGSPWVSAFAEELSSGAWEIQLIPDEGAPFALPWMSPNALELLRETLDRILGDR